MYSTAKFFNEYKLMTTATNEDYFTIVYYVLDMYKGTMGSTDKTITEQYAFGRTIYQMPKSLYDGAYFNI